MSAEIKVPRKLIEVALPLDLINLASAREKSIRQGHPSTLHLWWARRPLATARAVIFAQMVNDPGYERSLGRGVNKEKAEKERKRLFEIIEKLVLWENSNNRELLEQAHEEILKSWRETCSLNKGHPKATELFDPDKLPAFHDPFAGGGAIPLEAQRLGLETYASDLNPVAVIINKSMIEIPPKFSGSTPVGPHYKSRQLNNIELTWPFAHGLAEDVRRYGAWVRAEALKRIGHLYPDIVVTKEMAKERPDLVPLVGEKLTIIAWIWARTVKSPNPRYSEVDIPLVSTFVLSSKKGKEHYVEPIVRAGKYFFKIRKAKAPKEFEGGTKLGRGASFKCLMSGAPIESDYIYTQAQNKRMGARLMAIVAEGSRGRIYLDPNALSEKIAGQAVPTSSPGQLMPENPRWFSPPLYGLKSYGDLFTSRQLLALNTFSELIDETVEKCRRDAAKAGFKDDSISIENGGTGATAYSQAVAIYLAFAVSKLADRGSSICGWDSTRDSLRNTFGRQAIPMVWDYAEANFFSDSSGSISNAIDQITKVIDSGLPAQKAGYAYQAAAQNQNLSQGKVISTDPPYYDNIGYADLSDFFYIWLSRCLKSALPGLFVGDVPKINELVATPYRHGGRLRAEKFFLDGMIQALQKLYSLAHPAYPTTIYYAFKQSETTDSEGTSSTGWETFLQAVMSAGFSISGTWPMRTELGNRMIGSGTNALASSVVLVCNRRLDGAAVVSRREFIRELNITLPLALDEMTSGGDYSPVAPVDLSQAIIGPGMAIFSKYKAVLEADGTPMSVKTALRLINRFLSQDDFDHDTQFCLSWFDQHGWDSGRFGEAEVLARAKGTSVDGLRDGGIIEGSAGTLKLIRPIDLPEDWQPENDCRISVWEILHQMIRRLVTDGESGAGEILGRVNQYSESIRTLAYRLYTLCERKGWAQDSSQYDQIVRAWDGVEAAARATGYTGTQIPLFGEETKTQPVELSTPKKKTRKKKQ